MQTGLNAQLILYKNLARYFDRILTFIQKGLKILIRVYTGLDLTSYSIQIGIQWEAFDTIDLES